MTTLKRFQYGIVKHCNLNCEGCSTFAGLQKKGFISVRTFEKDIVRMSELFNHVEYIDIYGGEPLLHPLINYILGTAKASFPKSKVVLRTNGLLLKNMSKIFWKTVRQNNIQIDVSLYPLLKKKKEEIKVILESNRTLHTITHFDKFYKGIVLEDHKKPDEALKNCRTIGGYCPNLVNGRLYHCGVIPNLTAFNSYHNKNIRIDEGIDIYDKNITGEQIISILEKPTKTCNYCYYKWQLFDWKNIKPRKNAIEDYVINPDSK